ncbi:MAG: sugar ABC transporter permease [Anaerolineae bacterium]
MQVTQPAPRAMSATDARARAARRRARDVRNFLTALAFLLPSLFIFTVFVFYPLAKSIYLSTYLTDPLGRPSVFVGLDIYYDLLTDPDFQESVWVSFKLALLIVPSVILLALALAVLANQRVRGIGVFRLLFASTVAVSTAIASNIFLMLYSPQSGTINWLLGLVGLPAIPWLLDAFWAPIAVAIATVWMTLGFTFIVLLAGMQGIPDELYESAALDGASGWPMFRHITVPLLSPTLFFVAVVTTIAVFQAFTQIYIMTKGGPSNSTNTIVFSLYLDAFQRFQFGIASAQAMILFAIMLVLTILQFRVLERRVHYG